MDGDADTLPLRVQVMDNLIPFVPEILRYLPPIALDAAAFVLVDRLALPRSRTQEDGLTAATWLSALAELTGGGCGGAGPLLPCALLKPPFAATPRHVLPALPHRGRGRRAAPCRALPGRPEHQGGG